MDGGALIHFATTFTLQYLYHPLLFFHLMVFWQFFCSAEGFRRWCSVLYIVRFLAATLSHRCLLRTLQLRLARPKRQVWCRQVQGDILKGLKWGRKVADTKRAGLISCGVATAV